MLYSVRPLLGLRLFIGIAAMLCFPAHANQTPWRLQVNLASKHLDALNEEHKEQIDRLNETNLGLGLEYHKRAYYLTGGGFYNSFRRVSVYLGAGKDWPLARYVKAGLNLGGATGYVLPITPVLTPYTAVGFKDNDLKMYFIPPINDLLPATIGFQLRVAL